MKKSITRSIAVTGSLLLATGLVAVEVSAAGFQVSETSVSALGRAFAGAGISAEGPSDMFHNPAGLMLSSGREMEFGLHSIHPNAEFKDDGSIVPPPEGPDSNGGTTALVPNFFYATNRGADLRYGIGLTSPFGLTTEYDPNWIGRYHAIKSELITVELNPTMAMRVTENLSLGGGITLIKAEAELSQAQYIPTNPPIDARVTVKGDDIALGFNLGIVAGDENARLGFGYRSKVDLNVDGELTVNGTPMSGANADLTLPATAYLSGFKKLNHKLDLLATIRWTDWSTFKELRVEFDDDNLQPEITPYNWQDSNTYSIGVNYRPNHSWTLRGGYARDESPIAKGKFRTPRIPDGDRDWLTLGGSYQASAKTRIDFAFAHLFTDAASVRQPDAVAGAATAELNGTYENTEANIFAIQLHYKLGTTAK